MQTITIIQANLDDPIHQRTVLALVDAYSQDEMGDGGPLSDEARQSLIPALRQHPTTMILVAYKDKTPVGIAVCFRGFSTFAARPLLNIHDLSVMPGHRGEGIGLRLLRAVEEKARELGCCKLTLEVQEKNTRARKTYKAAGFAHSIHSEEAGPCYFLSKRL
ncbi:MAG TPA: GNAT family N-acetyltransferase [Candidatus Saccharimonadales bacterium]|nr:GNAT family N-acetyltransferase [Candidatus Saccharimonadales bacterium]